FNDDPDYKWFVLQYKNFINDKDDDIEYEMLTVFVQKLKNKLNSIFKELNEKEKQEEQ
ncbi:unnamed protein product, partial [Rotaria sp. Silwood2]